MWALSHSFNSPLTPLSPLSQPNMDGEVGTAATTLIRRMRSIENAGRIHDETAPYLKVRVSCLRG